MRVLCAVAATGLALLAANWLVALAAITTVILLVADVLHDRTDHNM